MHREEGICFQEHSASFLLIRSSCELVCTSSWFDMSWNIAKLLRYFPEKWPNAVLEKNLLLAHLFHLVFRNVFVYSVIGLGVVTSPARSRRQWKQALEFTNMHSYINVLSRMSGVCQKITLGKARSWNFSANIWEEDLRTHQRHGYFIARLVLHKHTINSLSALLKFWEYVNVIYWPGLTRYECGCQTKQKALEQVNQFMLSGSVYAYAPLEKWPGKLQQ